MEDKRTQKLKTVAGRTVRQSFGGRIALLFLLVIFVVVSVYLDRNSASQYRSACIPVHGGWMNIDGQVVDLNDPPPGRLELSMDFSPFFLNGRSLCMKSIDTVFDVYADGRCIYSYHPLVSRGLGSSYGMYVHTIPIPDSTSVLTLSAESEFSGVPAVLNDVVVEDGGQYMTDYFRSNLFPFSLASEIALFGLLFLIFGIFGRILMKRVGLDFLSFGVLCLLIGFIGFNDTMALQVLTRHPSIIRVITYICLILLPYPAMSFFAGATGNGSSRLVPVSLAVSFVNFAIQVLLVAAGIADYYHMVYISHGIIALSFAAITYLMIKGIREHTMQPELLHTLITGIILLVLGVGIDFVRYYLQQSYGSSSYTRIGVLLFMLLIGIYLFREQIRALKEKQQENTAFISEITTAFAKVIDMKDSYTNGHLSRVARYTAMLTRELGYDDETVEKYYRIALLHDIGKIGIPKSVLNKPGKLTDEEYETIKSHTSKGYEALRDISIMPELATGARSHHERPDGKGYPQQLSGDEIPRVAQIIAVADCFDAMYSNRPYRKRMNFDKAVSIIREVSGTQLTPDVVDAFMRLVDKGEFRDPEDSGGGTVENIDNIRN